MANLFAAFVWITFFFMDMRTGECGSVEHRWRARRTGGATEFYHENGAEIGDRR